MDLTFLPLLFRRTFCKELKSQQTGVSKPGDKEGLCEVSWHLPGPGESGGVSVKSRELGRN